MAGHSCTLWTNRDANKLTKHVFELGRKLEWLEEAQEGEPGRTCNSGGKWTPKPGKQGLSPLFLHVPKIQRKFKKYFLLDIVPFYKPLSTVNCQKIEKSMIYLKKKKDLWTVEDLWTVLCSPDTNAGVDLE